MIEESRRPTALLRILYINNEQARIAAIGCRLRREVRTGGRYQSKFGLITNTNIVCLKLNLIYLLNRSMPSVFLN